MLVLVEYQDDHSTSAWETCALAASSEQPAAASAAGLWLCVEMAAPLVPLFPPAAVAVAAVVAAAVVAA